MFKAASIPVVPESYLDKFVLNGGWSMCLLLPFSIVTLAVSLRCLLSLRERAVRPIALALRDRMAALPSATAEDRRAEAYAVALQLYASLQPLWGLFVLSPLVGLAGSITMLMTLFDLSAAGQNETLHVLQHALIPPLWAVIIAAIAYTAAAICRAWTFRIETDVLLPAALDTAEKVPGT